MGARSQPASKNLNRWGHIEEQLSPEEEAKAIAEEADFELTAIENFLESSAAEIEDRVTAASHVVTIKYAWAEEEDDSDAATVDLEKATDVNNLLGGYAITVHKAQGSEYDKVFLLLHQSHATMISRELIYTAMTRAAKHLYIICEPNSLEKAVRSQRIKGDTLAEKAEFFKGKLDQYLEATTSKIDLMAIAAKKARVEEALKLATDKLCAQYPNRLPVSLRAVTYIDKGSSAGQANMSIDAINISPLYLEWDEEKVLREVVPHEVAHIFAAAWFKDYGHGTAWRQLCIEAGGTGDTYHDMGAAKQVRTVAKATLTRKER